MLTRALCLISLGLIRQRQIKMLFELINPISEVCIRFFKQLDTDNMNRWLARWHRPFNNTVQKKLFRWRSHRYPEIQLAGHRNGVVDSELYAVGRNIHCVAGKSAPRQRQLMSRMGDLDRQWRAFQWLVSIDSSLCRNFGNAVKLVHDQSLELNKLNLFQCRPTLSFPQCIFCSQGKR